MSKFIDRLKQLSEGTPQPMGFRRREAASRLRIQLVASLANGVQGEISAETADAAILQVDASTAKETIKEASDKAHIPVGVFAGVTVDGTAMDEAGADFAVFPAAAPLQGLAKTKLGKVMKIDPSLSDGLLRTVNAMPIDAVIASFESLPKALTWQDLMGIQRVAGMVNKPVLLPVPPEITETDLKAVWDAGVHGVVVEVTAENAATLNDLRQKINGLEFPSPSRRDRPSPSLPRMVPEPEQQEDQDEE